MRRDGTATVVDASSLLNGSAGIANKKLKKLVVEQVTFVSIAVQKTSKGTEVEGYH